MSMWETSSREGPDEMRMGALFDPFSRDAHHDPYPAYAWLRASAPVHFNKGRDLWFLSRYDDVQAAARDWETFSSAYGNDIDDTGVLMGAGNLVDLDPPLHDELRDIVRRWYAPKAMSSFEPAVRSVVGRRLGELLRSPLVDVLRHFIWPLHVELGLALLGIRNPPAEAWCDPLLNSMERNIGDPQLPRGALDAAATTRSLIVDFLGRAVEDGTIAAAVARRCRPDLAPGLLALLLAAAVDTPSALLGNALHLLARHPEQRRLLIEDPALIAPAIEECLRFESPEQSVARVTTCEVRLHGQTIPKGSRVVLLIASANRDERRFAEPDRFLVTRSVGRNLAFGEGIHFCLGASLARLISRVALEEVLGAVPDYRVRGLPLRFAKQSSWGLRELWIDWQPGTEP